VLKSRVLTAIALLAGFLGALFLLPRDAWILCAGAAVSIAAWEWSGFTRLRRPARLAYVALVAALALWIAWNIEPPASLYVYGLGIAFWAIIAPAWLSLRPQAPAAPIMLIVGLAALLPMYLAIVELRAASPVLLLAVMAIVWLSDSVAYFTGRRFGQNKLAPSISPGKTWEGVWGALIAVALYGLAWAIWPGSLKLAVAGMPASIGHLVMILFIVLLAVAGVIGDLFESQMKRQAGVKDSGSILPGHGGVLDRIDALMPVLPLAALVFLR
jgi:phosphatidate cytidylyltransferase